MKKWWLGERKHIDQEKLATKARAKKDLRDLLDVGDENGYVAYVKALNPDVSPEELVRLIELFREEMKKKQF